MKLASLGSGSKGNATLLVSEGASLLIDCGFSLRELRRRAARHGFDLASLDALLITHEHSDHASGAAALAEAYQLPVYLTHGTATSDRLRDCPRQRRINADSEFVIGDLTVRAVAVPHDAREPVQYHFRSDAGTIGVLTDLGSVTPHVVEAFRHCDLLLLEFNHDREMLQNGPYHTALKRRVGGDWGHLANTQAVELLRNVDLDRLRWLIVAHISEQNNQRQCVENLLARELPELLPRLVWADQQGGFPWLALAGREAIAAY